MTNMDRQQLEQELFFKIINEIVPDIDFLPAEKSIQYKMFYEKVLKMFETHLKKDLDYGSSFYNARNLIGNHAYSYVLSIKSGRFFSLMDSEVNLVGEKIEDTILDLANYSVMELVGMEMDADKIWKNAASRNPITDGNKNINPMTWTINKNVGE